MTDTRKGSTIPQWGRFEQQFTSAATYTNPFQDVTLTVQFTSPSGRVCRVEGFWDGGTTWRVRFAPDEIGPWSYTTSCTVPADSGLHGLHGSFTCGRPAGITPYEQHGPLRLSEDRRHFAHADGTPFFWLADTAWNGPLLSTPEAWDFYLAQRTRQRFTTVQWVTTQWLASPHGDLNGDVAYTGHDCIAVNPHFFRRLDRYHQKINDAGLLSVPVMLWAAVWRTPEINAINPGTSLPEDQAARLSRYMLARWSASFVAWILPGDGHYDGEIAERWKRIGRAVFGDQPHAPVTLHPGGLDWPYPPFYGESWLDFVGYQSGHSDDERTFDWIVHGPPATDWKHAMPRPFVNLEPCYENHRGGPQGFRHDAYAVRRATYWSLLNAPTAGVTYGGHGVWGWDDGTQPPTNHENTGIPLPWREALVMPGAEQLCHLIELIESVEWWRLRPAPDLIAAQPASVRKHVAAARSDNGDLVVVYIPDGGQVDLNMTGLPDDLSAIWFDPRTGQRLSARLHSNGLPRRFETPGSGDWILLFGRVVALPTTHASGANT